MKVGVGRTAVKETFSAYRAPRWLPGGHAQTLWPLLIKAAPPACRRERWDTPDGDFIDLDWADAPGDAPLVLLFHGLEGSSASHYATALLTALREFGWAGAVAHFRGCSGEPNRLPRAYHSGDSAEIDWILRRLRHAHPQRRLYAAGVSLGGNALLKWLGEQGSDADAIVDAAAAISAPLDLTACGHHLGRGFNRVYTQHFLRTLKPGAAEKLLRFPGLFDGSRMARARNLHDFDDAVTAPLHGFRDVADYWRRASAKPFLNGIRVPTLLLNARNDPFLPAHVLPQAGEVSAAVTLEQPQEGGHVGFVSGAWPGRLDWLPRRLLHFFAQHH
ncbi:MAG: hydrolase [Rhodocyclaceae bacterium]|nr:hydrolase [Rhodocyclaceae bacterium]